MDPRDPLPFQEGNQNGGVRLKKRRSSILKQPTNNRAILQVGGRGGEGGRSAYVMTSFIG